MCKYVLEGVDEEICQVSVDGNYMGTDEVVDLLNEQDERIRKLEEYIKNSYVESVCEKCRHGKSYLNNNYWSYEYEFECLKGNEDLVYDDCPDFELMEI